MLNLKDSVEFVHDLRGGIATAVGVDFEWDAIYVDDLFIEEVICGHGRVAGTESCDRISCECTGSFPDIPFSGIGLNGSPVIEVPVGGGLIIIPIWLVDWGGSGRMVEIAYLLASATGGYDVFA